MRFSDNDKGIEVVSGQLVKITPEGLEFLKTNPKEFWRNITSIGDRVFSDCNELTSITIPKRVKSIGKNAFANCKGLVNINIQKGVKNIGGFAFSGCSELTSITIPKSVKSIGLCAFDKCSKLASINIKNGVKSIVWDAFRDCINLESITIPKSVTDIGYSIFNGCGNLTNVVVAKGNTRYDSRDNCNAIIDKETNTLIFGCKNTLIPKDVTKIGSYAFQFCDLEEISIPANVTHIEDDAFSCCVGLKRIDIQKGVTSIGASAFYNCRDLAGIKIPDSVISINDNAFSGCSGLTSITIPSSVTSIGSRVFSQCDYLTSIVVDEGNVIYDSRDNCNAIIEKSTNSLILGCENTIIPDGVINIGYSAFMNCSGLKEVKIPDSVTSIGDNAFSLCGLKEIKIPDGVTSIGDRAFDGCNELMSVKMPGSVKSLGDEYQYLFKYAYLSKDGKDIVFSKEKNNDLIDNSYEFSANKFDYIRNLNYRKNYINVKNWKKEGKVGFVPPDYTIEIFPNAEMEKYFVNKNNLRWKELVKKLGFDTLNGVEKNNYLTDLMKVYYAIGGFSNNKGESEKAYEYVLNYVAVSKNENPTPTDIGKELHKRFSRLSLNGAYNKTFAKFFMKYYKDNPDFMNFQLENRQRSGFDKRDYLCAAHNSFERILKQYPNRTINGNEERALLTPQFIAEHCSIVEYKDIDSGNEKLATLVGEYGYTQQQFRIIQSAYNKAKSIKDKYVIFADKADEDDCITYRVLEKDDPLGFVLGDITNCCQVIGGAGATCVDDGYTNPNAGFMVFEENIKNESGKNTGKTRVLGQAYVWYDAVTKTVCYDNIEIPTKIINELRSGNKVNKEISSEKLIEAVEKSAMSVMTAMNKKGVEVKRVTTGEGFNDLNKELSQKFKKEINPKAQNRNSSVYSDAKDAQYIIATYKQTTNNCAKEMRELMSDAEKMINEMKNEDTKQKMIERSL